MKAMILIFCMSLQCYASPAVDEQEGNEPKGWFKESLEHTDNESDYALMVAVLNEIMVTAKRPGSALVFQKFLNAGTAEDVLRMKRVAGLWSKKARAKYWEPLDQFWEKSVRSAHNKYPKDKEARDLFIVSDYNSRTYRFYFAYFHENYDKIAEMIRK